MVNHSKIRLLVMSPRRSRREAVRKCVELDPRFVVFESEKVERLARDVQANDIDAVLLIQPEMHELLSEYLAVPDGPSRVPVIAIGRRGAKPVSDRITLGGLAGYLPMQELGVLPQLLKKLLARGPQDRVASSIKLSTDALRESQKMISIGRLTAEIAHEINNPLESVGNLLYLARAEANPTDKAAQYLQSAERELARVVQISKQTLSFYRESLNPVSVRMADLMDEVVDLYSRRIEKKQIDLVREYQNVSDLNAMPGEIRQVLSNLVTNAIEASTEGGKLRLRIRNGYMFRKDRRIRGLRLSVADTGAGIPAEARKRLGELFFTTKGQSGTGLGLWVTRAIIKRYGGAMCLKSRVGQKHGTVFHVFLPFHPPTPIRREPKVVNSQSEERSARLTNVRRISDHPLHSENKATPRNPLIGAPDEDALEKKLRG